MSTEIENIYNDNKHLTLNQRNRIANIIKKRKKKITVDEMYLKVEDYEQECIEEEKKMDIDGFCNYCEMSNQTYYNYRRDEDYFDVFNMLDVKMKNNIIQSAYVSKNSRFHEYMLNNRFSKEFANKSEVKHSNNNDVSDEEVNEQLQKLLKDKTLSRELFNMLKEEHTVEAEEKK